MAVGGERGFLYEGNVSVVAVLERYQSLPTVYRRAPDQNSPSFQRSDQTFSTWIHTLLQARQLHWARPEAREPVRCVLCTRWLNKE